VDRHDEANIRSSQIFERAKKTRIYCSNQYGKKIFIERE